MALNLGRTRSSTNGSQDSTLRAIKQVVESSEFKGKQLDATAVNQILAAISESQKNSGEYQLELASANNDTLIEKIKDVIKELYDQQSTDAEDGDVSSKEDSSSDINSEQLAKLIKLVENLKVEQRSATVESPNLEDSAKLFELQEKLNELKSSLDSTAEEQKPTEKTVEKTQVEEKTIQIIDSSDSISQLQSYISSQFSKIEQSFVLLQSTMDSMVEQMNMLNSISTTPTNFSKTIAETVEKSQQSYFEKTKNVLVAPFNAIGSMFSDLNPFKKKKKKKPTTQELKLGKMIDKVIDFIDNFFDRMLSYVDKFLERVLKSAKKIVNSLMFHVLKWLFVNVALIGLLLALIVKFIVDPLMKALEPAFEFLKPLMDGISYAITELTDLLTKKVWPFLETKVWPMITKIINWIMDKIDSIWDKVIVPLLTWFSNTFMDLMDTVVIPFVKSIATVIKNFVDGLSTHAKAIGEGLGKFVTIVLNGLCLFVEGLSAHAKAIGEGLGKFVTVVLGIMIDLFEGFKTQARAIGEALGIVVLGLVRLVNEALDLVINVVRIINAPIKFIADMFDGIGTRAKQIGEKIGDIVLTTLVEIEKVVKGFGKIITEVQETILSFLRGIKKLVDSVFSEIGSLTNLIKLYVMAPIAGIQRKFRGLAVQLAENFVIKIPTFKFGGFNPAKWGVEWNEFKPFDFATKGWTPEQKAAALSDAEKPISQLISEEMKKMQANIAAEEESKKAAELAKRLQQKQIEDLLKKQSAINDLVSLTKTNTQQLNNIAVKLGLEEVKVEPIKIEENEIPDATEKPKEEKDFKTKLMRYLDALGTTMNKNFQLIIEKLDEKPNVIPLPYMNLDGGDLTMMEDR